MSTIRFGGYQPERSVHSRGARVFCSALGQQLGPGADIQFTANIAATGRPVSDLLTLTQSGELDMCYFASSYLAAKVPELTILDLPFESGAFESSGRERVWSLLDGAVGARIKAAVAARTGYQVLGFWDNGIRHISNGVRPIRSPADCTGLSIRTLDNSFHQAIFAALGFVPRFIDVKDLGAAVVGRTIDAQENPLTNMINFDIHKTHKHVTLLGQFFGVALLLANRAAAQRWPVATRTAVEQAAAQATQAQRRYAAEEDDSCMALLKAASVAIVPARDIDLPAFKAAVAGVVEREAAMLDPELLALWRA